MFLPSSTSPSIGHITLADSIMIWRCWRLWRQCWLLILLPILLLISATAMRIISISKQLQDIISEPYSVLYVVFNCSTALWCTIIIIYRILTVIQAACKAGVAWLDEDLSMYYFDFLGAIARGIAPTLFVLRIAGGLIQPDNSCNEHTISSLHFGTHSAGQSETTSQQDSMLSVIINGDLEAQQRTDDEHGCYVMMGLQEDNTTQPERLEKDPGVITTGTRLN
ncbi:hypothetical protein ARMGADRAFT_1030092 [Armillaria gallica]|uniref:Uncharacterized protein n=1 Tax=Armillaria gallica TaxID=47427 RepID=A0A2H3DDZ9_ARMGA|nr:hypothetical protein ARMGADRAFT_1030092 [Armillaria gallica]